MRNDLLLIEAVDGDYKFAWSLFEETIKPYFEEELKRNWDSVEEEKRFLTIWNPKKTQMIVYQNKKVGWISTEEGETLNLENGYIQKEHRGIGKDILEEILKKADQKGVEVSVTALKKSPYIPFYEHFGFRLDNEDEITNTFKRSIV